MCAQAQLGAYGSADKVFVTSAGRHNHPTATQVGFGRSALQDRASESAGPASPCQACVGGRVRYHDVWIVSLPVSCRARRLVPPPRWALVAWQTKLGERKRKQHCGRLPRLRGSRIRDHAVLRIARSWACALRTIGGLLSVRSSYFCSLGTFLLAESQTPSNLLVRRAGCEASQD